MSEKFIDRSKRNFGIDLLRLLAMYFVIVLHVLGQGGILNNTTGLTNSFCWLLEVSAYCDVDCYALITGYVCYRKNEQKYRYSKIITFWTTVFFYSLGITILIYFLNPRLVEIKGLIKSMLPIVTGEYWYVNAYFGLFFVIPWLNKYLRILSRKEFNQLVLVLFTVFSVFALFSSYFSDVFNLSGGYSFVWLLILYIIGAWIKKNEINNIISNKRWCLIIFICIMFTWMWKMFTPLAEDLFLSYISFTILLVAISLISIFSKLNINRILKRIIYVFSPAAFGVYLIHTQRLVWTCFFKDAFLFITHFNAIFIIILVLVISFFVFVFCLLIERIRLYMFKVLKIDKAINIIQNKVDLLINNIFEWL